MAEGSDGGPARERESNPENTAQAPRAGAGASVGAKSVEADTGARSEIEAGAVAEGSERPPQQHGSVWSPEAGAEAGSSPWW